MSSFVPRELRSRRKTDPAIRQGMLVRHWRRTVTAPKTPQERRDVATTMQTWPRAKTRGSASGPPASAAQGAAILPTYRPCLRSRAPPAAAGMRLGVVTTCQAAMRTVRRLAVRGPRRTTACPRPTRPGLPWGGARSRRPRTAGPAYGSTPGSPQARPPRSITITTLASISCSTTGGARGSTSNSSRAVRRCTITSQRRGRARPRRTSGAVGSAGGVPAGRWDARLARRTSAVPLTGCPARSQVCARVCVGPSGGIDCLEL
jgi:hypothetical protein